MNKTALKLKLNSTNFANPHGLVNNQNKSTAYDMALLCHYATQNYFFREIVNTINYKAQIINK